MRPVHAAFLAALVVALAPRAAMADRRTEAVAKVAMTKAQADFIARNYGTGFARLQGAIKACGTKKCLPATRAALTRDLGAMAFRKGDQELAAKYFADALAIQPDLSLTPAYDAPDVHKAFLTVKSSVAGGHPSVEFVHDPPVEQKVDTPLPIYVEGGGDVVRVLVQYKGAGSPWRSIELSKLGKGWGGLIPCADVQAGDLNYYIQGLDASNDTTAASGDAKHLYSVQITDTIAGETPHLPGMKPPAACHTPVCPPGSPDCGKKPEPAEPVTDGDDTESTSKTDTHAKKTKPSFKRFWFGVAGALDFQWIPPGGNLCALDPATGMPNNTANIYCTDASGEDFPPRSSPAFNSALQPGNAGTSNGGIHRAEVRVMLSYDYALTANFLIGARVGFSLFPYTGQAAFNDGRAWAFASSRFYADARGTLLIGDNALAKAIAPMFFLGIGVASFDADTSSTASLTNGQSGAVNLWQTGGPFFILAGAGVHFMLTESVGGTLAVRGNGSIGADGFIPTFGPEAGLQVGF